MKIGLKIDVDTFRGTRLGVRPLLRLFESQGIKATFYFSVGPDNMGRHLFRLFNPAFLMKMLKSNASGLYGWDILFKGTLWPGPIIGEKCADIIREAHAQGHEIGLHAWDHHAWQTRIGKAGKAFVEKELTRGVELLASLLGKAPISSACPAWKCNETVLSVKEKLDFQFNSDCRGHSPFYPLIGKIPAAQPQIPTTLPTYDEVIGRNGITSENYNSFMLDQVKTAAFPVLTVHAEAEGLAVHALFQDFVERVKSEGGEFVPLGSLLGDCEGKIPAAEMVQASIPGREGWLGMQKEKSNE